MGLETFGYISDLVATNPVGATDQKAQGDDHIRGIKSTLLASFPNIGGAVTLTHTQINDAARKSAAQTFSAVQTFGAAANIRAADQAAGDPAYSFTSDTDSGMYLVGDGQVGIATAGALRAMFSSAEIDLTATTIDINGSIAADNTITVSANVGANFVGTSASRIKFTASDAGTNEDLWDVGAIVSDDSFRIRTRTDADGVGNDALKIVRSGTTVSEIELNATLLDFNGDAEFSGAVEIDGIVTLNSHTFVTNNSPRFGWYEEDAGTDEKGWLLVANGDTFSISLATDADFPSTSNANTVFSLSRSGQNLNQINIDTHTLVTADTSASEIGFKGAPSRDVSSSTNTAASDSGKSIRLTGGSSQTFTLDGDPPEDAVVVIDNASGNSWTIAASGTLIWALTGATGNRTLADDGLAVAIHRGSGVWVITGGGLT